MELRPPPPGGRPFAAVEIHDCASAAREAWAQLQGQGGAFQTMDFVAAWAEAFEARLAIAVARGRAGAPVALLPLHVRRWGPVRVASFAGGGWANYHFGLFRRAGDWRREDVEALLREAGKLAGVDLFAFTHQPASWEGRANPLLLLPARPSPNEAFASALPARHADWLDRHFSRATQKKQRKKARKLEVFGEVRRMRAGGEAEARACLDALYAHKAAQARARNEPDPFADPRSRRLLLRLAAEGVMETHALVAGERIAATFGALVHEGRLSGLVVSYDPSPEIAAASPGEWLLIETAGEAIARGLSTFDLGAGESRYKKELCEIEEPLFDSAFPVTPLGRLAGALYLRARAAQGWIKHRPALLRLARRLRG